MNKSMSVKQVVSESGLSENYVRKCIRKGDLKITRGFKGNTNIPKNFIAREDFEAWNVSRSQRRDDGRSKFVIYMTEDEEITLRDLVNALEFGETLVRAYTPKPQIADGDLEVDDADVE